MLIRATVLAVAFALFTAPAAHAIGVFAINGSTLTYSAETGDVDQIAGVDLGSKIRFTNFSPSGIGPGPGCAPVDSDTVDCDKTGVTSVVLNLGDQNDVAVISPTISVPIVANGDAGNDALFGGSGVDTFFGGPGDDNIMARDGHVDNVNCGDGHDTAVTDDSDIRVSCEEIEGDADGDGVRRPADCDDTRANVHPGAIDVPENGIDEDCSGADAAKSDRDGDGTPAPQDCDDTNPAIRPTTAERIGNDVDENCDGRVEPFPPLTGSVVGSWTQVHGRTRNLILRAKGFPSKTRITLKCTGSRTCPKGTVRRTVGANRRAVNLHLILGKRTFPKRARIQLSITRATRVGRVLRYRMGTPGLPDVQFLCRPPGGSAGPC